MAFGDSVVDLVLIIGTVAGERGERIAELVKKRPGPRAVVNFLLRQLNGDDLAAVAIDADMQLAPGAPSGGAVLLDQPFAGAAQLQPGAVDEQVQGSAAELPPQRHGHRPGPAAQGRMVRHRQIEPKQADDGADQPFGLPERQTEDGPHRQRRGDRQAAAQMAEEAGHFDLEEVARVNHEKLVRRHPHVFGNVTVETVDEVHQNWEQIKAAEKADTEDPTKLTPKLTRYARSLPPLLASLKISKKAVKAGFEWDDVDGVWDKFHEELDEFHQAVAHESQANQEAELGDLLFTLVNIARWHGLDPAAALQGTNQRFIQRFALVESVAQRPIADYSVEELEALWQQAKAKLKTPPNEVE